MNRVGVLLYVLKYSSITFLNLIVLTCKIRVGLDHSKVPSSYISMGLVILRELSIPRDQQEEGAA